MISGPIRFAPLATHMVVMKSGPGVECKSMVDWTRDTNRSSSSRRYMLLPQNIDRSENLSYTKLAGYITCV